MDEPGSTDETGSTDAPGALQAVVMALAEQVAVLLPQARACLGEARFAGLAGRTGQIHHEALRGVNDKTLLEDKVWLDETLAELLGLVAPK
jgi:hypothetical protein